MELSMSIRRYVFGSVFLAALALSPAAPEAATIPAASCTAADVQAAITASTSGDTVLVPAGNCTWSTVVTVTRDIKLQGAGVGKTVITGYGACVRLPLSKTVDLSGFEFVNCGTVHGVDEPTATSYHRLHHNKFASSGWTEINIRGAEANCSSSTVRHASVLIDNNVLINMRILVQGTPCMLSDGNVQHRLWAQAPPAGSWPGIVYIEDNQIQNTHSGAINWIDGNYGGRYIARFNTITNTGSAATYAEVHSVQGLNRAVQHWEFYKNTLTQTAAGNFGFAFIRGGSGVVWGNRVTGSLTRDLTLDNMRSQSAVPSVGACNGSSNWDQNLGGMSGYGCRDQIGRQRDAALWSPGQPYTQDLRPAYFWGNERNGVPWTVTLSGACSFTCLAATLNQLHLGQNRDWYNQQASFTGATGVGVGPLASRPSSCTPGVGYWATDQGSWNVRNPTDRGQLYRCTASNTWSLHYTPFTYPHPLQGGATGSQPPTTPSNVRIVP
jgi:hypothetical protein